MANRTMTAVGNAQIDTAQSKFGGASGLFDGSGDYLTTNDDAVWALGTGKFTIDVWVRLDGSGQTHLVCGQYTGATTFWGFGCKGGAGGFINFGAISGGTWLINFRCDVNITEGAWHHIAVVRNGTTDGTIHLFLDGVEQSKSLDTGAYTGSIPDMASSLYVGNIDGNYDSPFDGWMDELRIVIGTAVWTSNFTPPSARYNYDSASGTELLLHMDGADASTTFLDHHESNPPTDYPLTMAQGSFTLSGQALLLHIGRKILAVYGAFVLTGQAVALKIGRKISLAVGSFVLTGQDVLLKLGKGIVVGLGSFVLTGQSILFHIVFSIKIAAGTFALTSQEVIFRYGRTIALAVGNFTLTGISVALNLGRKIVLAVGSFTLTGQDLAFHYGRKLVMAVGSFALTGQNVALKIDKQIVASVGTFVLTGQSVVLFYGRALVLAAGSFTLTGQTVLLKIGRKMVASVGSFVLSFQTFQVLANSISNLWTAVSKNISSWTNKLKS